MKREEKIKADWEKRNESEVKSVLVKSDDIYNENRLYLIAFWKKPHTKISWAFSPNNSIYWSYMEFQIVLTAQEYITSIAAGYVWMT